MTNKYPPRRPGAPRRPGRPTKFDEQQLAEALHYSRGSLTQACAVLLNGYGCTVDRTTMGRLVASSPRLQAVRLRAKNVALDYVEALLWRRIEAGDLKSIQLYLLAKGAHRGWVMTARHEGVAAAPVAQPRPFDFSGLSPDQLESLTTVLADARARALVAKDDKDDIDEDE